MSVSDGSSKSFYESTHGTEEPILAATHRIMNLLQYEYCTLFFLPTIYAVLMVNVLFSNSCVNTTLPD